MAYRQQRVVRDLLVSPLEQYAEEDRYPCELTLRMVLLVTTTLLVVNLQEWTYFADRKLFLGWSNLFIDVSSTPGYSSDNSDLVLYRDLPSFTAHLQAQSDSLNSIGTATLLDIDLDRYRGYVFVKYSNLNASDVQVFPFDPR
jgi:hypothetical protein